MKRIALFTSGGDAPGMNPCIRAVVRTGIFENLEVFGIKQGLDGLIDDEIEKMESHSVANIINRGGTILKSARSKRFYDQKWRKVAYDNLKKHKIDGLIGIGGDGTFKALNIFSNEFPIQSIGVPGTIDNDIFGTDYTIGYDTAINTVVEAVDKIRDTANSHNRLFFVEVMGRDAGLIALRSGIACGAEAILIPETPTYIDKLIEKLKIGRRHNKTSGIIIVAEGDDAGGALEIAKKVNEKFHQYETRVSILGHMQRGGNPTAMERVLASRLGHGAVEAIMNKENKIMVGIINGSISYTPLSKSVKHHRKINEELIELADILSI